MDYLWAWHLYISIPSVIFFFFCSVVPQTTVILNNDRQNSIVAKMVGQEEPLSRAADSLENILSKWVTFPGVLPSFPPWAGPVSKATWREKRGILKVTMRERLKLGLDSFFCFSLDGREHPGEAGISSVLS